VAPDRSRLLWRCRRGRKELDLLLLDWVEQHFEAATAAQRARFAALLELSDPDLEHYLMRLGRPLAAALAEPSVPGGVQGQIP
jgi:antitoxin CptB